MREQKSQNDFQFWLRTLQCFVFACAILPIADFRGKLATCSLTLWVTRKTHNARVVAMQFVRGQLTTLIQFKSCGCFVWLSSRTTLLSTTNLRAALKFNYLWLHLRDLRIVVRNVDRISRNLINYFPFNWPIHESFHSEFNSRSYRPSGWSQTDRWCDFAIRNIRNASLSVSLFIAEPNIRPKALQSVEACLRGRVYDLKLFFGDVWASPNGHFLERRQKLLKCLLQIYVNSASVVCSLLFRPSGVLSEAFREFHWSPKKVWKRVAFWDCTKKSFVGLQEDRATTVLMQNRRIVKLSMKTLVSVINKSRVKVNSRRTLSEHPSREQFIENTTELIALRDLNVSIKDF